MTKKWSLTVICAAALTVIGTAFGDEVVKVFKAPAQITQNAEAIGELTGLVKANIESDEQLKDALTKYMLTRAEKDVEMEGRVSRLEAVID